MAGESVEVIRSHPFERRREGSMGATARHLRQFSVGDLLDQRVRNSVGHLHAAHVLDREPGRTEALHGFQEDFVVPSKRLLQDGVRHDPTTDRDQIEDAALGRFQMLQASQDEVSDIRGQDGPRSEPRVQPSPRW